MLAGGMADPQTYRPHTARRSARVDA
jgi:hypothetical protein